MPINQNGFRPKPKQSPPKPKIKVNSALIESVLGDTDVPETHDEFSKKLSTIAHLVAGGVKGENPRQFKECLKAFVAYSLVYANFADIDLSEFLTEEES